MKRSQYFISEGSKMTDTYFAAKISKELPELQSSDAIWYKICRIQVKMKCIFRRSFTFGSFSCVLPMHLINITNSISITHFLFFKPTKCFCHHQTHHSSSKYNYCSKPCQLNCVFHDIFFSFLFYCSVIVVPFFFFFLIPRVILLLPRLSVPSGHWMSVTDFTVFLL